MFSQAASFIKYTNRNLFLTGKAGTGKTTFLHYIKESCSKKLAVLAPTGVAAINAGGTTIHSFFLLPWGTFLPTETLLRDVSEINEPIFTRSQLKAKLKFNRGRLATIRELELLIIDEISMVRADLLDAIDFVLKTVRQNYLQPFGGVQMLFIGDMMQLPPVLKNQEDLLLRKYYDSPYFFDALVICDANLLYIELSKIFRQSNEYFIGLLNKIRYNRLSGDDLKTLNSYYRPDFLPSTDEEYITLTSHNYLADRINQTQLDSLDEELIELEASVLRNFPERMYPTDKTLYLKKGAQIMFIKNDKGEARRFYNGKIGVIEDFYDDEIVIVFKNETEPLFLKKETWKNIKYSYNTDSDSINEEELGTFSQYPIRLAWAITIHKSQGLTFERAIIDAGASFAAGQVYVALSRLSSLDGLVLRSRISPLSISTDDKVVSYSQQNHDEGQLSEILKRDQIAYIHQQVLQAFDWNRGYLLLRDYQDSKRGMLFDEENMDLLNEVDVCVKKLGGQKETAEKFVTQLRHILPKNSTDACDYVLLQERVKAASKWFSDALSKDIIVPLEHVVEVLKSKSRTQKRQKEVYELLSFFTHKKELMAKIETISEQLTRSVNAADVLDAIAAPSLPVAVTEAAKSAIKLPKGETKRISLQLFQEGKTVREIAKARGLVTATIEGHLISFIPSGEISVDNFVSFEKVKTILDFYRKNPDCTKLNDAKTALGKDFSYVEIKAALVWGKSESGETKKKVDN